MTDSNDKEHRISNLKNLIDNVKNEESDEEEIEELDDIDDIEEDKELIEYLNEENEDYRDLEIDDEFIYHPGDEDAAPINLEEDQIDEDFIIKTPKSKDIDDNEDYDDYEDNFGSEISENFDNVINAKFKGKSILAMVSSVLGVIFVIISLYIFQSRSDRVIDNVVAGETSFMFVIFFIAGLLLIMFGIFKLLNLKNPLESIEDTIDNADNDNLSKNNNNATEKEKPSPKKIPASKIPLDKDSYKIGEFNIKELKSSLKKPANSKKNKIDSAEENAEDFPHAKEKEVTKTPSKKEENKKSHEEEKLESESIDDIFSEVEEIDDKSINSLDN